VPDLAIPDALAPFAGRMLDVDSHEMLPAQVWREEFGPATDTLADRFKLGPPNSAGGVNFPDFARDDVPIDADTVWNLKGCTAPGAVDVRRRLDVMDYTGVSRQLMYPSAVTTMAVMMLGALKDPRFMPGLTDDREGYARELLLVGNEWLVKAAKVSDRVRPVPALWGDTLNEFMDNAESLVSAGIRAVNLLANTPPAGRSPAHSDLDPLWALFAKHDVAVTIHTGSGGDFLRTSVWGDAPAFEGFKVNVEFDLSPWHLAVTHLAVENYVATLVTGGVFERHPTLRFGAIELGAYWIGPLAQRLDLWHDNNQNFGVNATQRLPRRPSEYIARNVRVTPFHFEPVDDYIDKHGLADVYCYSSDYPHIEGGKSPMHRFAGRLERLGPEVMEKFFVRNGELLLPA
jgi:predicted TIM-barrel fold metal-dependent hydrolase